MRRKSCHYHVFGVVIVVIVRGGVIFGPVLRGMWGHFGPVLNGFGVILVLFEWVWGGSFWSCFEWVWGHFGPFGWLLRLAFEAFSEADLRLHFEAPPLKPFEAAFWLPFEAF